MKLGLYGAYMWFLSFFAPVSNEKVTITPLYTAVKKGDIQEVKRLLTVVKTDPNKENFAPDINFPGTGHWYNNEAGETPLLAAIDGNHSELVDLLMQHGADVNGTGNCYDIFYPLARAAYWSNFVIFEKLYKNGAYRGFDHADKYVKAERPCGGISSGDSNALYYFMLAGDEAVPHLPKLLQFREELVQKNILEPDPNLISRLLDIAKTNNDLSKSHKLIDVLTKLNTITRA